MDEEQAILIVALGLGLVALVLAYSAHRRLSSTRRSLTILQGSFDGTTLLDAVAAHVREMRALAFETEDLAQSHRELAERLRRSARHVAVVRYDAFEDMGGEMSFSAALLDDQGNGVVITSINGRTEARTYAKPVAAGESDFNLSPEERQAISKALNRRAQVRK